MSQYFSRRDLEPVVFLVKVIVFAVTLFYEDLYATKYINLHPLKLNWKLDLTNQEDTYMTSLDKQIFSSPHVICCVKTWFKFSSHIMILLNQSPSFFKGILYGVILKTSSSLLTLPKAFEFKNTFRIYFRYL